MNTALLRLFNSVKVANKTRKKIPEEVAKRTIKNGYVLHPSIKQTPELLDEIEKVVGLSGQKMNSAFHKSWSVVRDASDEQLVLQQIMHYVTTYGYGTDDDGFFNEATVFIPNEVLEVPEIDRMPLTVVKGMNEKDILKAIVELGSGIALAQKTLDDIMTVVEGSKFKNSFVEKIGNRELKVLLYDFYGICPSEPVEYLRYVVSKLTNESLLIKNKELIGKLEMANGKFLDELIKQAPDDLASIFLRFKPIFLAMKKISRNKTFFNRLRKQAKKMHKPMPEDFLNSVTSHIKNGDLKMSMLKKKIKTASVFRKIRLANALNFRLNNPNSIVYRVRNGRAWTEDFEWAESLGKDTKKALDVVVSSIADSVRVNVDGKKIYIPRNMNYALPATEKQFTGNLPTGSYVTVPDDLIVGLHWTNNGRSIDIDLSMIDADGKIGWDGAYRTGGRGILFSGDVTNAPKPRGATELFFIKKDKVIPRILMANYYNFQEDSPVSCKIIVASETPKKFKYNYMVDPNNVIALVDMEITKKQCVLGLVTNVDGENRMYFSHISGGGSISASCNAKTERARQYMIANLIGSLNLKDILSEAGAEIVEEKPEDDFIDLSPEALDKTTITKLIK